MFSPHVLSLTYMTASDDIINHLFELVPNTHFQAAIKGYLSVFDISEPFSLGVTNP